MGYNKSLKVANKRIKKIKKLGAAVGLAQAYFERGQLHERYQHIKEAIMDYNSAIYLDQDNKKQVMLCLGLIWYQSGDMQQALEYFKDAYDENNKICDHNTYCFYYMGMVFEALATSEKARKCFHNAIKANPDKKIILECYNKYADQHTAEIKRYLSGKLSFSTGTDLYHLGKSQAFFYDRSVYAKPAAVSDSHTQITPRSALASPVTASESTPVYEHKETSWEKMNYYSFAEYMQDANRAFK